MKLRIASLGLLLASWLMLGTAASAQSACDAVAGNLVTNCGFETGNFTGWALDGNTGFTSVTDEGPYVNTGTYGAQLGPVGSDGTLTQTLGDLSSSYSIQFSLYNDRGSPNDFTVFWNGVDIGPDLLNAEGFAYTTYFLGTFAGNSGPNSNTLEFVYRQDPAYWGLDDVVVLNTDNVVPEPGTLMLFGTGILGLAGVLRRKLLV